MSGVSMTVCLFDLVPFPGSLSSRVTARNENSRRLGAAGGGHQHQYGSPSPFGSAGRAASTSRGTFSGSVPSAGSTADARPMPSERARIGITRLDICGQVRQDGEFAELQLAVRAPGSLEAWLQLVCRWIHGAHSGGPRLVAAGVRLIPQISKLSVHAPGPPRTQNCAGGRLPGFTPAHGAVFGCAI
jgi:hypothetical protein